MNDCTGRDHDYTCRWKTAEGKRRCYWCGAVEGEDDSD